MLWRNTLIYGLTRGGAGLINLLAVLVYTRVVSPQEYGQFALVIATVALANAVLCQWLRSGLRRFLPAHANQRDSFLATVKRNYLGMVILGTVCAGGWLGLSGRSTPGVIVLAALALFAAQAWYDLTLEILLVDLVPVTYGWVILLRAVIALSLGGTLAASGFGVAGILTGFLVGYALPPLAFGLRRWGSGQVASASAAIQGELLRYGLPLTATYALEFVVSMSDRFLLGALSGLADVGRYAASYDLAFQSVTALLMIVNLAAFPLSVRAVETLGIERARSQLLDHATLLLLLASPALIGLWLLAPNLAHVIIGAEFRLAAAELLPLVAGAAVLAGMKAYYFDLSFQLGRSTIMQVWVSGATAIVNLLLNILWIPELGAKGAALATLTAYGSGCLLSWRLGGRGVRMPLPLGAWTRIVAASAGMGLVLLPFTGARGAGALAAQVLTGLLVYAALVLAFNVRGVRPALRAAVRRLRAPAG